MVNETKLNLLTTSDNVPNETSSVTPVIEGKVFFLALFGNFSTFSLQDEPSTCTNLGSEDRR